MQSAYLVHCNMQKMQNSPLKPNTAHFGACNTLLCTHLTPMWSELQLICGMGNPQSADELLL